MSARIEFKDHDNWALYVSIFGGIAYGNSISVISGILGEPRWIQLSSSLRGLLSASILYGIALGSILPVFLSDIFGRKLIFIISGFKSFVFSIILAFMNSTVACIIIRAFAGIGVGSIATLLIVGLVLGLLYHFTGLNVITFYLPEILANAGVQNRTTLLLLTLAIGVWNSITSIPQLFFINRVGRRMVLLVGSIVQLFGMFLLMLSTLLPVLVKNEKSYYMAIPGIIIFFAGFEIGIGPVFLVMIAEMFPEKITSATSCFLMTVMWIANLTIVTIYSPLSNSIGDSGVFIITFVLTFILVVFTIIVVKETKGMYPRTNKAICQEENRKRQDSFRILYTSFEASNLHMSSETNWEDILRRNTFVPIRKLGQGSFGRKGIYNIFVLKYTRYSDQGQYPYLVMEYANMQTLNIIAKQPQIPLPSYTLRALMKQILEGMRVFHSAGLIHRDIKCDNILLHSPPGSGRVHAKISDFGFAKQEDLINEQEDRAGTLPYMAPEILKKNQIITQKVDIYALGITFYHLVTHKYPVNERNIKEQQNKMLQLNCLKRPSEVKNDLFWDILSKLLDFDPDKRITAEQALQHPYFTSPEALTDISPEQEDLAQLAVFSELDGDKSITEYDKNSSFTWNKFRQKKNCLNLAQLLMKQWKN
ncbi:MAG: putative sugar porter family MFS transporter [Streblomastix strix]|uniref:Putative sugar porter family MFS transporter n=1 Tax=Streblomastix strix TaxID=222440 RepID=A0A5J4X1T2_9EUKA|nr:MAG: putative sugar porter family MFS transporter [Streblomastix strix]